jgi:hypothetical protein
MGTPGANPPEEFGSRPGISIKEITRLETQRDMPMEFRGGLR